MENLTQSQILQRHDSGDPIREALKGYSTHREAKTRITVYERLGLNKPGFWVDQSGLVQKPDEQYGEDYDYTPKGVQYKPFEFPTPDTEYGASKRGKPLKQFKSQETSPMSGGFGTGGRGPGAAEAKQFNQQFLSGLSKTAKGILKNSPLLTTTTSDLLEADRYNTYSGLTQNYAAALKKDPLASFFETSKKYYFDKSSANALVSKSYSSLGPTVFERMSGTLHKEAPKVKGNTGAGAAKQIAQPMKKPAIVKKPQMVYPGRTNLNVHSNSYASTYIGMNAYS